MKDLPDEIILIVFTTFYLLSLYFICVSIYFLYLRLDKRDSKISQEAWDKSIGLGLWSFAFLSIIAFFLSKLFAANIFSGYLFLLYPFYVIFMTIF